MKRVPLLSSSRPFRMRFGASLLAAAGLVAAPLATSSAQYAFGNSTDVCGGNSFIFCLAISSAQGTGNDASTFYLTITNEALHGSDAGDYGSLVFTSLGFNGVTPSSFSSPAAGTSFAADNNLTDLSNFPGTWVGVSANNPPPHKGLLFGESITFAFANTTASSFPATDFAIHAQAGPAGCSGKLEIDLSKAAPTNPADFTTNGCGELPVTSTPEPASLVLLATGVSGLGGLAFRRRRKA